jgi:hypothetical protein
MPVLVKDRRQTPHEHRYGLAGDLAALVNNL